MAAYAAKNKYVAFWHVCSKQEGQKDASQAYSVRCYKIKSDNSTIGDYYG